MTEAVITMRDVELVSGGASMMTKIADTPFMPTFNIDAGARQRLEQFLALLVPVPGQITIVEVRNPPLPLLHLVEEILIPAASAWGWFTVAVHAGGLDSGRLAAIGANIKKVGSNSGLIGIAPGGDAEPWLRLATELARRYGLRLTVISGAPVPRAFRHRAIEINRSYIKRGDKRLRIDSLGAIGLQQTAEQIAKLAEARRQYAEAWGRFDSLHQWQGERAN
jgi:hypothetical protein